MKAVIRISTRMRSTAPIPREFHVIAGLEHLGLIYKGLIITTPDDFNTTLETVNNPRFANRGCEFFPYMLTEADDARMSAISLPTPQPITESKKPETVTESSNTVDGQSSDKTITEPVAFRLEEGRKIMLGEERIGGLFGDDKQLRVLAKHSERRPEIEAWLQTLAPSES